MPLELVFATNNHHKLEEVSAKLGGRIKLLTLADIGCDEDIEETGTTFSENASIKSRYVYEKYGLNCFGDDSGLEVETLDGEPGVYSARYAGEHGNHNANIDKLLESLEGIEDRAARFISIISLIWEGSEYFFEGAVEGMIRHKRTGVQGFGYDPVFQPTGFDITFAEMSLEEKNKISHRSEALKLFLEFLNSKGGVL